MLPLKLDSPLNRRIHEPSKTAKCPKKSIPADLSFKKGERQLVHNSFLRQIKKAHKEPTPSSFETTSIFSPSTLKYIDSKELSSTPALTSQISLFLKNKPETKNSNQQKIEHNFFTKIGRVNSQVF